MTRPDPLDELRVRLREAARSLDSRGRLAAKDGAELRARVARVLEVGALPSSPTDLFGRWADLPEPATHHLRSEIERENRRAQRARLEVPIVQATLRSFLRIHALGTRPGLTFVRAHAERAYQILSRRPARWRRAWWQARAAREWRRSRRPRLVTVMAPFGESPLWLLGGFAEGVRIPSRYRSYRHDPDRNVIAGFMIGLDLIPSETGVWCVESNLNAGLPPGILSISYDFADAALATLQRHGAERLVWIHGSRAYMNTEMRKAFADEIVGRGCALTVLEDPSLPPRRSAVRGPGSQILRRGSWPPHPIPRDTLVLRVRGDPAGMGSVVQGKDRFLQTLAAGLELIGTDHVRVPQMSRRPPPPPDVPLGFPNLVYKYPSMHRGKGVHFLRAHDADHAVALADQIDRTTGMSRGLFQPFVVSTLRPVRRVQHVRAMLQLTPTESTMATCVRLASARSVPPELKWGVVEGEGLFASNLALGGTRSLPRGAEREAIERATVAVGDALRAVLDRAFQAEAR